jgi:hypothetical protein
MSSSEVGAKYTIEGGDSAFTCRCVPSGNCSIHSSSLPKNTRTTGAYDDIKRIRFHETDQKTWRSHGSIHTGAGLCASAMGNDGL